MKNFSQHLSTIIGPILALLLVYCLFWGVDSYRAQQENRTGRFATTDSFKVIPHNAALVGVAALGMTVVIIAGGIDLSAAAAIALAATTTAYAVRAGASPLVGVYVALITGCLAGAINGVLIGWLRVVPFIVTLGTMTIFRGVGRVIAEDKPIRTGGDGLGWLAVFESPYPEQEWLLVSVSVWVMLGLAAITAFILRYTLFGRYVVAIGSNEEAARLSGINVNKQRVLVYTLAGFFFGVSALFQYAKLYGEGDPTSLPGRELDIIAAVVIGGGSLSGGRGSILGTLSGALMMEVIRHGCVIVSVPTAYQQIIIGVIVIAAVTVDQMRHRRSGG